MDLDQRKVALGNRLFHEPRLSGNEAVSCASCHDLARGGADAAAHSVGADGTPTALNAPTVFNSGLNIAQFWDGRAESLEAQVEGPLLAPSEMASSWPQIIATLGEMEDYRVAFEEIYREGITRDSVKDAIATFERSLITPNSRFDRFLRSDPAALTGAEQAGYQLFLKYGCASCHQGMNVGGNMFQKLGIVADYFANRDRPPDPADLGRFNVTGDERDRHVFKVPSLRNVELTAPYLHDGSAATLDEVVSIMARYQLGRALPAEETALIVAFLKTLTGHSEHLARR